MLRAARATLAFLLVANWVVGAALVVAMLFFGFIDPERAISAARAAHPDLQAANLLTVFRITLFAVTIMILVAHKLLASLAAIIDSIPAGAAFSPANAARLNTVAWAMLGICALDDLWGFACVYLIGPYSMWSFTLTGWLTALMLFVLAGVWREGAAMRADLEGTV